MIGGVVRTTRRVVLAAAGHVLFYYGARQVSDDMLGGDGLSPENRAVQRQTVVQDFCRLTGLADPTD